ncbi:23S rRNA (guanosine(2251)-2'-O)-methyltransferase RlmB [Eubacteriales bacterium OttesenSCG-928-K08]|nr:23S rRNA (guanosine(2251)-2'-O)-methyltransferase RlmB [Eubacteriales bacterium OttesenSCG-928-K08]
MGRNAVREAIKNDRSIDRILVVPEIDGSLREIINMAKDKNIIVRTTERKRLDELCLPFGHGNKTGNHQGILAMVPDIEYCTVEDILDYAKELSQPPFVLLLDEITDPHNLGSMLRSAACAGVHGVILPKRRSASITAAVAKASAGAVEYVKVAKVSNLNNAIARLKQAGVWIAGADMQGTPMTKSDIRGPLALVIGSEGEGLSRLVRENCDYLISIPMCGKIDSLNASVAAAILMFEKNRQDSLQAE